MSDSLSHLFSHIQNGQRNRILTVESAKTKLVLAILNILQDHGYIRGYRFHHNASTKLQILLKYKNQKPAINKIIRISKPSKRVYISSSASGAGCSADSAGNSVAATQLLKAPSPASPAGGGRQLKSASREGPYLFERGGSSKRATPTVRGEGHSSRVPTGYENSPNTRVPSPRAPAQVTNGRSSARVTRAEQDPIFFMQGILILSTSKGV